MSTREPDVFIQVKAGDLGPVDTRSPHQCSKDVELAGPSGYDDEGWKCIERQAGSGRLDV